MSGYLLRTGRHFADTSQRVSASRAGSVVSRSGQDAHDRRGMPDSIRRRFRLRVPESGRSATFLWGAGASSGKFGLQLAAAKSRVIPFSRDAEPGATRFDFLGFEFHWGKDRAGKPDLTRRRSRKKLWNSLSNFTQWCKQSRHVPLKKLFATLNLKLRGYYNYYGVPGNSDRLKEFFNEAMGTLWKWLNRRSQRRSFTRAGFDDLL